MGSEQEPVEDVQPFGVGFTLSPRFDVTGSQEIFKAISGIPNM
jgi:hypothetical protein